MWNFAKKDQEIKIVLFWHWRRCLAVIYLFFQWNHVIFSFEIDGDWRWSAEPRKKKPEVALTRLLFINQTGPTFYKLIQVKEEDRVAKVVVVFSAQAQIET